MAGLNLWEPHELYATLRDDREDRIPDYFLRTFYNETFYSGDSDILISELPAAGRYLAPNVLPTEQGKPVFRTRGERVKAFTPPYRKPKDAVRPVDARTARPSEVLRRTPMSLQERFDARVMDVQDFHLRILRTTEAWDAARAFIDGKLTVRYERDQGTAYPEVTIDFGRNPEHDGAVVGATWDDPDALIYDDLQSWGDIMRRSLNGGFPTRLYVGSNVASIFARNKQVKEFLNSQVLGNTGGMNLGLRDPGESGEHFIGTLQGGMQVWSYKDHVLNNDESERDILDPNDVLLVAPGFRGVRAYGALYDAEAMMEDRVSVDIYPKMWMSKDPGEVFLMHQSSPLPIPLTPNKTLRRTVIAG